jgi:hypothetical protein
VVLLLRDDADGDVFDLRGASALSEASAIEDFGVAVERRVGGRRGGAGLRDGAHVEPHAAGRVSVARGVRGEPELLGVL